MHVEIKIVNKEAVTKRSTLLHTLNRTFEQSDVMLIRKGKRKEVISTHIRAIVRECCVIMAGRNNKLKDQKGQAGKETHQKKSCHGSKRPFQNHLQEKVVYDCHEFSDLLLPRSNL